MNAQGDQRKETMSLTLWTLACGVIPQTKGLSQTLSRQARMHPQSKGDPVLGLLSSRALSPGPRPELAPASGVCQAGNLAEVATPN